MKGNEAISLLISEYKKKYKKEPDMAASLAVKACASRVVKGESFTWQDDENGNPCIVFE